MADKDLVFYNITDSASLKEGERIFVEIESEPLVLIKINGEVFAISDICTYDDGPLGDGEIEGHCIVCPRHGAMFDIRTGEVLSLPAVENTRSYPVRITENQIEVGISREKIWVVYESVKYYPYFYQALKELTIRKISNPSAKRFSARAPLRINVERVISSEK